MLIRGIRRIAGTEQDNTHEPGRNLSLDSPELALPIRRALRRVDLRLRSARSARGLGVACLVAALGSILGMAADFSRDLPIAARWGIWGVWVATVGLIVVAGVLRPWLRRSRWIDLAAVAERADPRLGECLTGSIALLDRSTPPNGSPALVAALVDDAAGQIAGFDPRRVKGSGRPLAWLIAGLAGVALVVAPSIARPDPFGTLALRFCAPWLELERVGWFALEVTPGDKFAATGADFAIGARLTPRFGSMPAPDSATLQWADDNGTWSQVPMTPLGAKSTAARGFEVILPRLAGSIRYRVSTTSATSRDYQVSTIEPPKACEFSARIEPPSYTKLPPSAAQDPSRIEAIEGSRIILSFYSCSPFRRLELDWPSTPMAGKPGFRSLKAIPSTDWKHATMTLDAEATGPFVLRLFDSFHHGLDGLPETRQITIKADAAPTLTLQGPPTTSEARPDDVLQLGIAARDDFAIASAEIHYEIRRAGSAGETQAGQTALKLDGLGTPLARGVASLSLRDLALQPGDSVAYRVRITDNRPEPKGPNQTWSSSRTIAVSAKAESMIARDDRLRRESFQARLDEIRVANASNRRETEQLRYAADAAQRTGAAWDAGRDADLAAREVEARAIEDKLQLLARDLQNDPTFEPLARPTRQAAEVEAEAGRAQLDQARKAADAARRLVDLRQADAKLGSLGNRLDEIRRKFDALAKLDLDRQKLRDLASREDALAAQAAQGGDKDKIAHDQDELRRALDSLLTQSPGLRANLLVAQSETASKLAQKARALAEKQRQEARKTGESPRASSPFRELAQAQKDLEDDARRLALEIDEPLGENGRGRLDTDVVRRAIEPIERGDLPEALRRLEEAENSLAHVTREVEDLPKDPKALARRLARRQELLANDVAATLGESRRKDITADEQAALVDRSKPLLDRQAEIARLADRLVPPQAQQNQAREAAQAAARAAENLRDFKPRESENAQNNARRALNQLAEALADPNRIRDDARRKLDEAKRKEEEVLRDLERALAETQPRPDKLDADAKAATDLADKLTPLVQRQNEATEALAKLELEPRLVPQRDRAAARAARLASQIQAVKDQAPPRRPDPKPVPPTRWEILGPLPTLNPRMPIDLAGAVDFGAPVKGPDGKSYAWKLAQLEGDDGKVDLGRAFNKNDNQAAFGVAEIVSPTRRKAQLSIGSDDSLTVWLNGKSVFEFGGSRGFSPGQDKVEVELLEGVNRLAIRCGNGNGEWGFAVNVSPPPPDGFDAEKSKALRDNLAAARVDALGSLYRLEQKAHGRLPADDLAALLAAEQKAAADALALERSQPPIDDPNPSERATKDRQRIATALRNLAVATEAPALQQEAVRLAEAAARADAQPQDARAAADAADALARRLADALPPSELARALARAERALENEANPAQLADRQKAIAAELHHAQPQGGQANPLDQAELAVREAAAQAERAKQADPARPTPAAVAQARARAIDALDKLADGPAPVAQAEPRRAEAAAAEVPADPALGLGPEQAGRAADLAGRQRQIRERLQSAMAERVAPQQDLKRETQSLARDLAELRDRAKEMNAKAQWQANAAAELAGEQAPRSMEQGANQLAQGKLDQARDAQRQAAELVERAAQATEDLAAGLKAEGVADAGDAAESNATSNGLSEARDSLQGASRKLAQGQPGTGTAQAAAPEMRQAAESLRAAAQASAKSPSPPPMGEPDPNNPNVTASAAGVAEADLTALQDLVRKKTGRQWGELPGHLRTEILQLSKGRYREDYARLIQLYFREIAADAGKGIKP